MARYFNFSELIDSPTANAYCLDNMPTKLATFENLNRLMCCCLDPIREALGHPIYINSGYRCPRLNEIVGGAPNSQHVEGCAADITTHDTTLNRKIVQLIQDEKLSFDQLIIYPNYKFLHISYVTNYSNRCQLIDNHLKAS